jgi:hypothetical protein
MRRSWVARIWKTQLTIAMAMQHKRMTWRRQQRSMNRCRVLKVTGIGLVTATVEMLVVVAAMVVVQQVTTAVEAELTAMMTAVEVVMVTARVV